MTVSAGMPSLITVTIAACRDVAPWIDIPASSAAAGSHRNFLIAIVPFLHFGWAFPPRPSGWRTGSPAPYATVREGIQGTGRHSKRGGMSLRHSEGSVPDPSREAAELGVDLSQGAG